MIVQIFAEGPEEASRFLNDLQLVDELWKWTRLAEERGFKCEFVSPKPHPPRNRGEGTGVDGLMPVGQEDEPSS